MKTEKQQKIEKLKAQIKEIENRDKEPEQYLQGLTKAKNHLTEQQLRPRR